MKRKVLLLSPGYFEFGDYGYHDMPNMGLLKIARYFKNTGVDFEYYDFSLPPRLCNTNFNLKNTFKNAPFVKYVECGNYKSEGILKPQKYYGASYSSIVDIIKEADPTEIWISSGLTYYWESVRDLVNICKEIHPNIPVLVGGIYATLWPQHCKDNMPVDYVHVGPLDDIDDLMPYYEADNLRAHSNTRTIQLGKGCNVNPPCSFCAVVAMDPKFKALKPDVLFNYIKEEHSKGVTFFRFWASQLLVPQDRIIKLLNKIIESNIKIEMVASEGVQPNLFTQSISDLMLKAGFSFVSIPMESINDNQVKDFRKPSDFNDYEKAVLHAQTSGFKRIKSFVMAGVPGQTYEEIIRAILDCWARDVTPALHQYTPIPGSYDWTRYTQFHNISPEKLHPSLWPGASDSLKVEYLEDLKRIAKMGPLGLEDKSNLKIKEIWDIYQDWARRYDILDKNGKYTYKSILAKPGYTSDWKDKLWNQSQLTQEA